MLLTAFILGLFGSVHCVGMCGPIALALPLSRGQRWQIMRSSMTYNMGRVVTYACIGLVFGLLGRGIEVAGFQKVFSVTIGLFLLTFALAPQRMEAFILKWPGLRRLFPFVKENIKHLFQQSTLRSTFTIGLLNGLLPCGLVYLAIAGAMTSGSMFYGAQFMAAFGLGTFPMMLSLTLLGQYLKPNYRHWLRKLAPAIMAAFALLLISRGLNIPLPRQLEFWEAMQHPVLCH